MNLMKDFIKAEKAKIMSQLGNSDFCLQDLIEASNMSRSRYIATFKEAFHKPPIAMVNQYRMEKAGQMIASTRYSMKRVAFEVGFADRHYFCRCFKNHYGVTATEYKKQCEERKQAKKSEKAAK